MTRIEGSASNVPPQRKVEEEVKGTAGSSELQAGAVALANFINQITELRTALVASFGVDVATKAMGALAGKMNQGTKLSFDVVKEAVLGLISKPPSSADLAKLNALKKLGVISTPLNLPKRPQQDQEDPFVAIVKTLNKGVVDRAKMVAEIKDEALRKAVEENLKQAKEIEEKEIEKSIRLRDPGKNV